MKIDFYAPCSVSRWVGDNIEPFGGSVSTALEAIEKQLYIDFCEDMGDDIADDSIEKLGYKIHSSCCNMTIRDGKLYVRVSMIMSFPVIHKKIPLPNGQVMDMVDDETKDFKKFLDICIDNLNGQMSDGWGECFEQHPFQIFGTEYYASAGNVEFATWYGIAVDNSGKIMRPVIYNEKSRMFDHGWVGGYLMTLDMILSHIGGNAARYDGLIRMFNLWTMKEFEKEIENITVRTMNRYRVDSVFMNQIIGWYIGLKKSSASDVDKRFVRQLRNYRKLFK